jgi:NADH-quinone oxidoreductase subunit C
VDTLPQEGMTLETSNMSEALENLGAHIAKALPGKVTGHTLVLGELTLQAEAGAIVDVMRFLREDPECAFISFIDVCGADYPNREKRFDVVYHLMSPRHVRRIRVKVQAGEDETVPSITGVFPGANWFEREAYDMYGVVFTDHPDLRRILTDYGFAGHPLRKDFPMTGFVEVRYDDAEKRVVYEPVKLNQEFRNFDFLSPWEGADYVLPGDEKAKA